MNKWTDVCCLRDGDGNCNDADGRKGSWEVTSKAGVKWGIPGISTSLVREIKTYAPRRGLPG